jgi:hypothetical protein
MTVVEWILLTVANRSAEIRRAITDAKNVVLAETNSQRCQEEPEYNLNTPFCK